MNRVRNPRWGKVCRFVAVFALLLQSSQPSLLFALAPASRAGRLSKIIGNARAGMLISTWRQQHSVSVGSTGPIDTILVNAADALSAGFWQKALDNARQALQLMATLPEDEQEYLTNLKPLIHVLKTVNEAHPGALSLQEIRVLPVLNRFPGKTDHRELYATLRDIHLDSVAASPLIRVQLEKFDQGNPHHGLWKDATSACVLIRHRIEQRMADLWDHYQRVVQKIESGEIRIEDYPEDLVALHEKFYAIGLEKIRGSLKEGHLHLPKAMDKEMAPYFNGDYVTALMRSFPGIGLNPVGWQKETDQRNEENMTAYVRYLLAKNARKELWDPYVQAREQIRSGAWNTDMFPKELRDVQNLFYGKKSEDLPALGLAGLQEKSHSPVFSGCYQNLFIFSLPELRLNPFDFRMPLEAMPEARRERIAADYVRSRFAVHEELKSWYERYRDFAKRVKEGLVDPDDYPREMVDLMNEIYAVPSRSFASAENLDLQRFLLSERFPLWKGKRSFMMKAAFPELRWTAIGFQEDYIENETGWTNAQELRRQALFAFSQCEGKKKWWKLYVALRKQMRKGRMRLEDYPDAYLKLLEELYDNFTIEKLPEWGLPSSIKQLLPPKFSRRETFTRAVFTDLLLHDVALKKDGNWKNEDGAKEYVRYKIALKKNGLWKKFVAVRRALKRKEYRLEDYPPQAIEVIDEIYGLKQEDFIKSEVLGLSAVLRKSLTKYFDGQLSTVLTKCFPELQLNPIAFKTEGAWDKPDNGLSHVRYRFATNHQKIWEGVVAIERALDPKPGKYAPCVGPQGVVVFPEHLAPDAIEATMRSLQGLKVRDLEKTLGLKTAILRRCAYLEGSVKDAIKAAMPALPWEAADPKSAPGLVYARIFAGPFFRANPQLRDLAEQLDALMAHATAKKGKIPSQDAEHFPFYWPEATPYQVEKAVRTLCVVRDQIFPAWVHATYPGFGAGVDFSYGFAQGLGRLFPNVPWAPDAQETTRTVLAHLYPHRKITALPSQEIQSLLLPFLQDVRNKRVTGSLLEYFWKGYNETYVRDPIGFGAVMLALEDLSAATFRALLREAAISNRYLRLFNRYADHARLEAIVRDDFMATRNLRRHWEVLKKWRGKRVKPMLPVLPKLVLPESPAIGASA